MKKYYSIGEMAKLSNLTVQTLRHYEKIGLLQPAYINKESNYRYYIEEQFYVIDMIKSLKYLGVPLEKIRQVQAYEPKEYFHFLHEQEKVIEQKIFELQEIKHSLQQAQQQTLHLLTIPSFGIVFYQSRSQQTIIKIKTENATPSFLPDHYFMTLVSDLESDNRMRNSRYGLIYDFKEYTSIDEVNYDAIYMPVLTQKQPSNEELTSEYTVIPAGTFLTIAVETNHENYQRNWINSYRQLIDHLKNNHYTPLSQIFEENIPTSYASIHQVQFILQLSLLIKKGS